MKSFINKLLDKNVSFKHKYWYLILAHGRGMTHTGLIMMTVAKVPEFLILIKVFNIPFMLGILIALILVFVEFAVLITIGHLDLQNGWMQEQVSLSNHYNPELQRILKNGEQK